MNLFQWQLQMEFYHLHFSQQVVVVPKENIEINKKIIHINLSGLRVGWKYPQKFLVPWDRMILKIFRPVPAVPTIQKLAIQGIVEFLDFP
jgi:hypothetical protein